MESTVPEDKLAFQAKTSNRDRIPNNRRNFITHNEFRLMCIIEEMKVIPTVFRLNVFNTILF